MLVVEICKERSSTAITASYSVVLLEQAFVKKMSMTGSLCPGDKNYYDSGFGIMNILLFFSW